jgi:hypothetical protein
MFLTIVLACGIACIKPLAICGQNGFFIELARSIVYTHTQSLFNLIDCLFFLGTCAVKFVYYPPVVHCTL